MAVDLSKSTFDAKLKNDAAAARFRIEGNYIVFDKTADLTYLPIPHYTLGMLLTHNPVASYTKLNKDLLLRLYRLYELLGHDPVLTPKINSSYRSPEYNKTVPGSSPTSLHTIGNALDLGTPDPQVVAQLIESMGLPGELGVYSWGCHMGVGGTVLDKWDKRTDTSVSRKIKDALLPDSTRNYAIFGALGVLLLLMFKRIF
jgi:hypothetical protein